MVHASATDKLIKRHSKTILENFRITKVGYDKTHLRS